MNFFDQLQHQTNAEREYLLGAPIIHAALAGTATRAQYIAFLTQAYHHVKHTVPLLMACGASLPERLEWLREAIAEYIERSEEHTSELQSLMRISYAVFCLKKQKTRTSKSYKKLKKELKELNKQRN